MDSNLSPGDPEQTETADTAELKSGRRLGVEVDLREEINK
jgi:hypothetical protein